MKIHPPVSRMLLSGIIFVVMLNVNYVYGIDLFEALLIRNNPYKSTQEGCSRDFIDKHTDLAWSHDHLTKAETWFLLFTKDSPDEPELLHKCADQPGYIPPTTTFKPECKTEIITVGLHIFGIGNVAIFRELKDQRLKSGCYNVILVDWMWGNGPDDVELTENIKIVAKQLAILIKELKKKFGLSANDFILTGHSFAAQMSGIVGQMEPVGSIIGIDPAGVLYTENMDLKERLDPNDAPCVHVLHTNAGQCLPLYFGANFTCGHTDVWFNDGLHQFKSCYPYALISFLKGDFLYGLATLYPAACSHFHSLQYYKASIIQTNDCQFIGTDCKSKRHSGKHRCSSCGNNGENCAIVGARGCECSTTKEHRNLYIRTKDFCPYCDNKRINTTDVTCGPK